MSIRRREHNFIKKFLSESIFKSSGTFGDKYNKLQASSIFWASSSNSKFNISAEKFLNIFLFLFKLSVINWYLEFSFFDKSFTNSFGL